MVHVVARYHHPFPFMQTRIDELAQWLGGALEGPGHAVLHAAARIEEAGPGTVSFVANPRYAALAATTRASALIVAEDFRGPSAEGCALIRVADPYSAFARVLERLQAAVPVPEPGVHPSAVVAPEATVDPSASVGPGAVLAEGVVVGPRARIGALVYLGRGVTVGEGSVLHPGVVVADGCRVGRHCLLQPGAVIGSEGFGFAPQPDGSYRKIPQLGIVELEDGVEIGANTTIDRATLGRTLVRTGAKLDNLVQLAHNVEVGPHSVLAAQSGVSGSTRLGAGVQVGGQAGFTGHLRIADGTRVNAQSGVNRSVDAPGTALTGSPAGPYRDELRNQVVYRRLPELEARIRELERRLAALDSPADPA